MLAPQRTHDAQLRERRPSAKHGNEAIELVGGEPVLGDERRGNGRVAWSCGNGHGDLDAGLGVAAGLIVGRSSGMDGRVSLGGPGFMRTGRLDDESGFVRIGSPAAAGLARAANFGAIAVGELLFPV